MDLFIFGLIFTFAFTSCLTDTTHPELQVYPDIVGKEWIQVDEWPSQDSSKEKINFFYSIGDFQERMWKINNKPIDSINSQTFKLSFQYWQTTDMFQIETYFFVDKIKYDLTANYSDYEHNWMPFKMILSKDQLKKSYFHFLPGKGDSVLAVKNLRVDYQQVSKLVASKDFAPGTDKYEPKNIKCNSRNCTLFDSLPKEMSWANENMPQFNEVSSDKLVNSMPFIFSTKTGQSVSIQYKNVPRFYDTCLSLKYKINFVSSLLISYNDNTAFNLERRPTASQAKDNIDWTMRTICASQLTQSFASSFKINLKSQLGESDVISVHIIESKLIFPKRERILPFITFNKNDPALTKMAAYDNQWISHDEEWEKRTLDTNDIVFNAKYSGNKPTEEITSYQMSNWLPKNFDGIKVRFNVIVENINHKIPFKLEVVVLDDKNSIKQTNTAIDSTIIKDTLPKITVVKIPITKQSSDFRVGLKVTYSGLNSDVSKTLFTIQKLDIGDNCIEDNRDINECSGHGTCLREFDHSAYTSKCKCNTDEYFGEKCQLVDFCKKDHETTHGFINGNDFCSTNSYGNCLTGATEFRCDCNNDKDKFWSTDNLECAPRPKCLTVKNDNSQECIEPTDPKDPPTFKCALGYININANGKDALKCVKTD